MKNLRNDDEGLIPLLIGAALVGVLGYSWLTSTTDDSTEFLKVIVVASLLFTLGLIALAGKLMLLPRPLGVVIGLASIGGSIYLVYLGRFPI